MSRPFSFLLPCAFLVIVLPAGAQKFQPKTIQFKGDPEYSNAELLAASGLKAGSVLTSAEMNDHSKRLMDSGVFDNLTYKFDGVDLVFTLIPAETLYPIHLDNLPLKPGKELDKGLHAGLPLYHGKVPTEGGLLNDVSHALEGMLAAEGIKATVTATQIADQKLKKITAMSFAITAPPIQVGETHLTGASAGQTAKATEILAKLSGGAYGTESSPNQLETNLGNFYRDQGYLEVAVHAEAQPELAITPESIRVPFKVEVQEGPIYRLAAVELDPGLLVSQAEYDKAATLHPGGVADRSQLLFGWAFIQTRYKSKGYLLAQVKPEPSFDRAKGTVTFHVTVTPGDVYRLSTVKFENVSDDLRRALLHNWQMAPDDVFDELYVQNFPATVVKQDPTLARTLSLVNFKWRETLDPETHTVALVVRLEKRQ